MERMGLWDDGLQDNGTGNLLQMFVVRCSNIRNFRAILRKIRAQGDKFLSLFFLKGTRFPGGSTEAAERSEERRPRAIVF
jgi:hypothetical protein